MKIARTLACAVAFALTPAAAAQAANPIVEASKRSAAAARIQLSVSTPCDTTKRKSAENTCSAISQSDRETGYAYSKLQLGSLTMQTATINGAVWADSGMAAAFVGKDLPMCWGPTDPKSFDAGETAHVEIKQFPKELKGGKIRKTGRTIRWAKGSESAMIKLDKLGRISSLQTVQRKVKSSVKVSYPTAPFQQVSTSPLCSDVMDTVPAQ